jgi:hypothetical protein
MEAPRFLCRPIMFHTPERAVHPPSWLDHTPFAFWIIDALKPGTFVELGCHSGNSYSSFAQAVQTLGLPTVCYAVDTWRGDPHSGAFDDHVFQEWVQYHDRRFGAFSSLIRSTFDEALRHFSDGSIDLLHIDGYHTFEAVNHDFEAWRPKLSRHGVVLCHDINVREHEFGVWRLWERLKGEYPCFEFRHGHGLGVVGVGSELPDAVRWLLSVGPDDASMVRSLFARLGGTVTAQYTAAAARRSLASELAARDERVAEAIGVAETLRVENSQLREALGRAEETIAAGRAEIEELTSRLEVREADRAHPTIVVVSHVGAWRPRAGNEYRLNRMLHWYRRKGYRVIPVIAPLPGEELSREALAGTAETYGNVIQIHRDGRIEHDLRDMPQSFAPLSTAPPPPVLAQNGAAAPGAPRRKGAPLAMERTFCHDSVVTTVLHLQQSLGPHVLQVEYIWMSLLLPLARGDILKVIDTVDVFSTIGEKVNMFGLRDVNIDPREEAERLRRADLIVAIQEEERLELERLAPAVPVITAGVDFDVAGSAEGATDGRILYVASSNPRNCKGLRDFLSLAWPRIRRRLPEAELVVVGGVAKVVAGKEVAGVTVAGAVDDATTLYREAALVINPVVAGTVAKIKTIEALARLRPIVTWPAGVDGLDPRLAARCDIAHDWYEFANLVIDGLLTARHRRFTAEDRALIAELVSSETVYAALDAAYSAFFERHRTREVPASTNPASASPAVAHAD